MRAQRRRSRNRAHQIHNCEPKRMRGERASVCVCVCVSRARHNCGISSSRTRILRHDVTHTHARACSERASEHQFRGTIIREIAFSQSARGHACGVLSTIYGRFGGCDCVCVSACVFKPTGARWLGLPEGRNAICRFFYVIHNYIPNYIQQNSIYQIENLFVVINLQISTQTMIC